MTTKKKKIVFFLSSICIIVVMLGYRHPEWFRSEEGSTDDNPEEELQPPKPAFEPEPIKQYLLQDIIDGFVSNNNTNLSRTICLIGLQAAVLDEWIKYSEDHNQSHYEIFIINFEEAVGSEVYGTNQTNGDLKEALAQFAFDQKLHQCDFVHFGELDSEDIWEAAWLASRMFTKSSTKALWSEQYAYNRTNAFLNTNCSEQFCSGFIPQINFDNRDDVALQIQYAKHIPKNGYSINFFAYNPKPRGLKNALKEAIASAKTYRKNHPKGGKVKLILFTSDRNFIDKDGLFDRIIGIRKEFMFNNERQWTTRVIFSSFAPARISLFVDADSWSCLSMESFFEFMDSHEFDFTITGHWPHDMIIPDCGVYAWKWNERTRKLMAQWFDEFDADMTGDDQGRLYGAMQKLKEEVTIGRTRSTHALRFAPGDGEEWGSQRSHQQTMILHGPVHIIHARETHAGVCQVLNQFSDQKRVFVCRSSFNLNKTLTDEEKAEKLIQCLHPVFNQTACNQELDNTCFDTNDWDANPDMIVRAPDFYVPPPSKETAPTARKESQKRMQMIAKSRRIM